MDISGIMFRSLEDHFGNLKAIVSVTFDRQLVVHDIKLIQSRDRMLLQMPASKIEVPEGATRQRGFDTKDVRIQKSKGRDVVFRDTVHPISEEFRRYLETVVILAYELAKDDYLGKEVFPGPTCILSAKQIAEFSKELAGVSVSYSVPKHRQSKTDSEDL